MAIAKPQTLSVIESISAGYSALNRRLWVILIPVAVNLYLAFGTHISLAPLIGQVRELLTTLEQSAAQNNPEGQVAPGIRLLESLDHADMRQPLLWINFLPLLERNFLTAQIEDDGVTAIGASLQQAATGTVSTVANGGQLLALIVALNLGGLVLSGLFLQLVANAVLIDQHAPTVDTGLRRWGVLVGRIALWVLLVCAIALVIGIPFLVLATVLALVFPQALALLVILWAIGVFWVRIYIGFAVEAMALDRVGPFQAIGRSFQVVRRNFFPTLGLLILLGVISIGLGLIWDSISSSTAGLLLACAASAYIGTGLEAARMIFYRERLRRARPQERVQVS